MVLGPFFSANSSLVALARPAAQLPLRRRRVPHFSRTLREVGEPCNPALAAPQIHKPYVTSNLAPNRPSASSSIQISTCSLKIQLGNVNPLSAMFCG